MNFKVNDKTYKIKEMTAEEFRESKRVYNRAFNDALKSDSPLRATMYDLLRKQGLWDDDKQAELERLQKEISDNEYVLHKGGIKKSDARAVSLKLRNLREELRVLAARANEFNRHTAEGQADNANFNYIVSVRVVNEDGSYYFKNYEDYLNRADDPVAIAGAKKLASLVYGLDEDYEASLIENQVLKELNFVNDQYQLVDSQGRLISEDGKLIDSEGRYIDEEGNFVDIYGHKVDENGNFVGPRGVFIDDEADIQEDSA